MPLNVSLVAVFQIKAGITGRKRTNWDVFDSIFENGPLLLNIWVCASCPVINFQHCRTLSFFMPRDPSLIRARKVSWPSGSEQKTCRGSERWAGREWGGTASSMGKECLLVVSVGRSVTHQKMLKAYCTIQAPRDMLRGSFYSIHLHWPLIRMSLYFCFFTFV